MFFQAVAGALWLVGLWAAAPLLRGGSRIADRLRDALVVGTAIPLVLAFAHLLYWPLCWLALIACILYARTRNRHAHDDASHLRAETPESPPYILIGALALVAWPPLVRPLLDGDTLSYHLPNAAAWAHAHSIWVTQTRYWWYPPVSELFASALYVVATPFALPSAGFGALALLGFRLYSWAREGALLPVRLADTLAAATVCVLPIALQAGSLENDVWLAAFFIEVLWSAPVDDVTVLRSAAMCALIKPDGWIYAGVALAVSRAKPRAWIAAESAFALWLVHDAVLSRGAFIAPTTSIPHLWGTTMIAHPLATLTLGLNSWVRAAPFGLLLVLVALFSPVLRRDAPLKFAGIAAVAVALLMPFGFADANPQLATGASLRYFNPALAAGTLVLAPFALKYGRLSLVLLLLAFLGEALHVVLLYRSDGVALLAVVAAIAMPFVVSFLRRARIPALGPSLAAIAMILTTLISTRTTTRFYADAFAVRGYRSGVFAWIAHHRPPRVAGWGFPIGVVNVLSPQTATADLPDANTCTHARTIHALIITMQDLLISPMTDTSRLHDAALCGKLLYRDKIAIAVSPSR
jgi:hypothetical protein